MPAPTRQAGCLYYVASPPQQPLKAPVPPRFRIVRIIFVQLRGISEHRAKHALVYAARAMKVELNAQQRQQLLDAYLHLKPWPDTAGALRKLKESGVRVVALSNFSPAMLRANAENAGLAGAFDALISTDPNKTYKPDPRAYQLGMAQLQLAKGDIVFAAFGDGTLRERSPLVIRRCG